MATKFKILAAVAIVIAAIATISVQRWRIGKLEDERDKYRGNATTLLADMEQMQIRDSLNAATVGELRLTLDEYERYREDDARLIDDLMGRNRDLSGVVSAQTETINELRANVRDSVVYLPGDTVLVPVQYIEYSDRWVDLYGYINGDVFSGRITTRDSLIITETVQYKRFLGFLWKTNKVKNRDFRIVSRNPNTKIIGFEVVSIEK